MSDNKSTKDLHVLVVEDEQFMMSILKRMLATIGIANVVEATDGVDALSKLEVHNVDVIIADIMMEPMNGLNLLKLLRTGMSAVDSRTPFLVFTGSSESSVFGTAMALDCDAFISKSENPHALLERINKMLSADRQIKEPASYHTVTIPDITIARLDRAPVTPAAEPAPTQTNELPDGSRRLALDDVDFDDVLARDLVTADGQLLFEKGTTMTFDRIVILEDLDKIVGLPDMWFEPR